MNTTPRLQRDKVDCPICLFSSGILADGKGTKCNCCGGEGKIKKSIYNNLREQYGDIIPKLK